MSVFTNTIHPVGLEPVEHGFDKAWCWSVFVTELFVQEFLELTEGNLLLEGSELGLESICQLLYFFLGQLALKVLNFLVCRKSSGTSTACLI